ETMSDPAVRARAIALLAPLETDGEMPIESLFETAGRIDNPYWCGFAICALVPRLSGAQLASAYVMGATLAGAARGQTLATVIPRVSTDLVRHATELLKTEGFGYWTANIVVELMKRGAEIAPYTWLDRLNVEDRMTAILALVERGVGWGELKTHVDDLGP